MAIAPGELAAQLVNTQSFIQGDSLDIVLTHRTSVPNGSGGYRLVSSTHPTSQRLRLIPLQDVRVHRSTADGNMVIPEYALLGMPDADIRRRDLFTLNGHSYEVVYVNENVPYQKKAEVIQRA